VKFICKDKGIKISDLEKKIGVSKGYISRLKQGTKEIGLFKAYKIANILGCNLNDLIESETWKDARIKELQKELDELMKEANK